VGGGDGGVAQGQPQREPHVAGRRVAHAGALARTCDQPSPAAWTPARRAGLIEFLAQRRWFTELGWVNGLFGDARKTKRWTRGHPSRNGRGAIVAHTRPSASNVVPSAPTTDERAEPGAWAMLTRAEAHALRRSAPLTPGQFKALGQLAERGVNPLGRL
jgi:hypothetical protein